MIPRIGVILLLGVAAVHCQQQQGSEDLDKLIDDVFGGDPNKNANTPSPNVGPNTGPNTNIPPPPVDTDQGTTGGVKDTRGTPGEEDGCTCVPYYLCPNGTVLTDGTGLLDIRAKPGLCEEYMDVCCKDPTTQPITPAPKVRRGCGQRNPEGVGFRITGDSNNEAQFGEFPWMTALLRRTILDDGSDIMVYQCGGALIHEKVVLTAAHCVASQNNQDNGELLARVGEWDTQTTNEIFRHQNIKVAKVIVHPGFKRNNLHNDFALLVLEQPVTFADNVDVVCLPTPGVVPLSRECYATGWGKDKFDEEDRPRGFFQRTRPRRQLVSSLLTNIHNGIRDGVRNLVESLFTRGIVGSVWPSHARNWHHSHHGRGGNNQRGEKGQYQVILKKIDMPIVPKDHCIALLRKTRLGPFYKLDDSFVCAGGEPGKDTCKGDGGSPLVCPIQGKPGTYEVTGLVAWGIGCGDATPGVYAGVAYAMPWINQELSQLGIRL